MPSDPRDYKVTLSSVNASECIADNCERPDAAAGSTNHGRPFISVLFSCCNAYVRVYRSPDASHYLAHCPKCAKSVRFTIGDEGTDSRSFVVR
jgi:hypothetical protein